MSGFSLRRVSLALRLAMASALFGLLIVAAGIFIGRLALGRQLEARSTAELLGRRDLVAHILSELPSLPTVEGNRHRFCDLLIGHDDVHLALVDPARSAPIASFSVLAAESIRVLDALAAGGTPVYWSPQGGARMIALRGEAPLADGALVRFYLSLDTRHDQRLLLGFLRASLFGSPVLLAAVAIGAWLIAVTGLAPLRRFRRLAASIGAESLGRRLPNRVGRGSWTTWRRSSMPCRSASTRAIAGSRSSRRTWPTNCGHPSRRFLDAAKWPCRSSGGRRNCATSWSATSTSSNACRA